MSYSWIGRLRNLGLRRGAQEGDDGEGTPLEARSTITTLSESDFPQCHHRQRISTHSSTFSVSDEVELPTSPVLSGSLSTVWASSIPSTPGTLYSSGSFTSPSLPLHLAANQDLSHVVGCVSARHYWWAFA
jgi:hypothetical protein